VVIGVLGLLSLLLLAYCILDVATAPSDAVRGLPKPVWFIVLLAPVLGPVLWFVLGRPERGTAAARKAGAVGPARQPKAPDDDEAFLRQLRRRTEEQRRRAEQERRAGQDDDRPDPRRDEGDRPA
jgi:hypothetical protein